MSPALLMVVGLVPNKLGAYERFMARFAEDCQKKGVRVDFLLAGEPLPEIQAAFSRSGSAVYALDDWDNGAYWRQVRRFVARYIGLIRERRYQLVSFSFCDPLSVLLALLYSRIFLSRANRPRAIWHQHSEQQRPKGFSEKYLSILKMASKLMDGVCPVYKAAAQTMQERGIARNKITVLSNGTTRCAATSEMVGQKRVEIGIAPSDFMVLSAVSLIERKNIPMMLRALSSALTKMPNLLLVVAGEGDQEQSLKELSCQLKMSDRVRWVGLRNDIVDLCAATDICVMTSYSEALPFFCIEAFAENKTIIATPAGGIPEIVQDGVNGVIVGFDDSEALAREILHLAQDSDLRRSYEQAAGETYRASFTLEQMVESYIGYYCRFLQ